MSDLPQLAEVDAALTRADAVMRGAEAHGVLCGMLCAQGGCDLSVWVDHVLGDQDSSSDQLHDLVHLMSGLHRKTIEQLNDALADFSLLLPDDDAHLSARTAALAEWCQGFIFGLAEGGVKRDTPLPADSSEIIQDIIQISRAVVDEEAELVDEDDVDYMELVEFVKSGVLLINEELQPLQTNTNIQ